MFPEDLPIVKRLEGLLIIWTDNVNLLPRCYKYTLGTKMTQILLDMLELIVLANGDTYRRVEYLKKAMNEFGLELHPNKIYLQSYTKGVKFVGCVVKYGRIMAGNRMVGNLVSLVRRMKDCEDKEGECERYAARLNSYFNFIRHGTEHATLSRINREIQADWSKYLYMGRNYVIKVKKKYKTKHKIIETVKKNRYGDESNSKKRRVRRARYKRKRRNRDV